MLRSSRPRLLGVEACDGVLCVHWYKSAWLPLPGEERLGNYLNFAPLTITTSTSFSPFSNLQPFRGIIPPADARL